MTLEEFYEATKDMPKDARLHIEICNYGKVFGAMVNEIKYDELTETIDLC